MESINQVAVELVDEAIDFADDLGIGVTQLDNEATVIDCGIQHSGGLEAGLLFAETQAGGLLVARSRLDAIDGVPWTYVELECDHPGQLAEITRPSRVLDTVGFSGVMSGPVQLLLGDDIPSVEEDFDFTVVTCYSSEVPSESAARQIAEETGKPTSGVFLVVCPLGSLSGRVALAATIPTGVLSLLLSSGIDSSALQAVTARAPIPPSVSSHSVRQAGSDAMQHAGSVQVLTSGDLHQLESIQSSTYANWVTKSEYGEIVDSGDVTLTDVGVPHCTIVGSDGGVVELGERNERLLREKWLDQGT